jgi:type IV pilus assembly protein PilN
MIRINLLPVRELQKQAALRQQLYVFCAILGVVATGTAMVWWLETRTIGHLEAEKSKIAAELERLKPIVDEVNALEKRETLLNARLETIQRLRRNQRGPVRVLDELSRNLPAEVWLQAIDEKDGVYHVTGYALTNFAVADLLRNLQRSQELTAVDLVSSEQSVIAAQEIKKFVIQFQRAGGASQPTAPGVDPRKPDA